MKYKKRCLIFDFDGVIADTDLGRYKILKHLLYEYDRTLATTIREKDLIGLSTKGFLIKYSKGLGLNKIDEIIHRRHKIFLSNLDKYCIPYANSIDTIKFLNTKYDLAIATTNKTNNVETQLNFLGVLHCFKSIMGRDVTENEKFEKDYNKVSKIIDREKNECIVIEDSDIGVSAAIKEGFYCIRFDAKNTYKRKIENDKVSNYNELKNKIDKIRYANNV